MVYKIIVLIIYKFSSKYLLIYKLKFIMRKSLTLELYDSRYNPEQVKLGHAPAKRVNKVIVRDQLREDIFSPRTTIHFRPMKPVDNEFIIEREY